MAVVMAEEWKAPYPTGPKPKCPTCGQHLPGDHEMVTVDHEKMGKALQKAHKEFAKPMMKGAHPGRE